MLCIMGFSLDYLDLALPNETKKIIKKEQFSHKCYFLETSKHTLHGENMQLNSLVDLLISLGIHLGNKNTPMLNCNTLLRNLDYIKTQNHDILKVLGTTEKYDYFKDLETKYTKIIKLLEEIKHLIVT